MSKVRKDKDGWYKFSSTLASATFVNEDLPNILCKIHKVPGMLYPHTVRSGKLSESGDEFIFDGKIDLGGIKAGRYYKNIKNIKKLLKREEKNNGTSN